MEEEREPEPVDLVRNVRVEEGQQAAHIIQTVDLQRRRRRSVYGFRHVHTH